MFQLYLPKWINKHQLYFDSVDDIPQSVFDRIKEGLSQRRDKKPLVSIVVIAYNEETNIIRSLSSLSEMNRTHPMEIIFVNNNSTDRTQEVLDRCGAYSLFEERQGVGWARQAGLDISKGTIQLTADSDSIYSPWHVKNYVSILSSSKAVVAYGGYAFVPSANKSRLSLAFYEFFRDIALRLRAINRPELCAGGANMGFYIQHGREIGWRTDVKRGEDGSMLLSLKQFGEIKALYSYRYKIWSSARRLDEDGSLWNMIAIRIKREFKRFGEYFYKKRDYNMTDKNRMK